ncbi:unnamed protein product [Acanthoscelides obtectus]|nr:unnamed protein product [Acanthoscelides obtectus]CAK1628461.1 hypothetical protein AOBTE_LOCUS5229 [Acanthoscelides obtectus]
MSDNGDDPATENGTDVLDHGKAPSDFTKVEKKAPNLATYYFKHIDTDSEMDKLDHRAISKVDTQSTLGETSEEEWTYTKTNHTTKTSDQEVPTTDETEEKIVPKPKPIPEDTIRRLVLKAEELVSPDKCRKNSVNKPSKVNKWLCLERPDDSCDASGEDDEKESQTSEDVDASTTTLREINCSQSKNSFDELNTSSESNQWCGSCMSNLDDVSNTTVINNFSISESALHKMNLTPKIMDRFSASANNFNLTSNNSTSSTVEEISPLVTEKTSPARRKKSKLKKKTLFGKSDTHLSCGSVSQKHRNLLIKSGSFSGYSTSRYLNNDRHSISDPPTSQTCTRGPCETSTTSGADSDEEFSRRVPNFKYGWKTRYLHNTDLRENSSGKNSLNATEEQSSSLSEQAWDNYQENYLSEAYSESHDSDAARRLLNFGEDYRNFIDSQSDWSAFSDMSPTFRRKKLIVQNAEDQMNEQESLKQLVNDSRDQLTYTEQLYRQMKLGLENHLIPNDEDLIPSCDRHIALLSHMNESSDTYKMTMGDRAVTTGLLTQWRVLKVRCMKMQEYRRLQKQILELKAFITSANMPDKNTVFPSNIEMEDIHNEIDSCNQLLETIGNNRAKLSFLNAIVHRFMLENQESEDFVDCSLKIEVSELYELFDNARVSATDKLYQMESLLPAWKTLESRLEQLQKDLKEDDKTIHLLDSSLSNGTFTDQTANSVRDIAKILSETTARQGYHPLQEMFTEGSFSDSGISDEGSEHEIGERQGRLAAIRRLVRQLEVGLSPDSKARQMMRDKLLTAEEELKTLQIKCRSLIAKTAACSIASSERQSQQQTPRKDPQSLPLKTAGDSGDPGKDPHTKSWYKRLFRASLTFQLVIITFVCLSCFYEPQCCDYMNNYSWSISPKFHYEGRPPI